MKIVIVDTDSVREFAGEPELMAAASEAGWTVSGKVDSPLGLEGLPRFAELVGPMVGAAGAARYETPAASELYGS